MQLLTYVSLLAINISAHALHRHDATTYLHESTVKMQIGVFELKSQDRTLTHNPVIFVLPFSVIKNNNKPK